MGAGGSGGAGRVGATREMLRSRLADVRRAVPGSALARTAGIVLAVQVATGVVRYLIQILFARRGGTVEFGIYSFAFGWTQLLVVPAMLGMTLSVLRFVPQYIHEERWGLLRGLIRRSCEVTVLSGVLFSAVAIGVVLVVGAGASQPSLILGMALIVVIGLVTVLREATRGTHSVVLAYGIGDLLPMGLILLAAAVLPAAAGEISAEQMMLATGIGFVLALAAQPLALRRAIPRAFAPGVRSSYELRTWLMLSVPLWLVTMFTLLINQSDLLVLGILKSPEDVGVYAAGSKTAFLVSFVLTAVSAVLAPVFVRHHAAGDIASLRSAMRSGIRLILWPSLAIAGVLFAWPQLILGAFGPGFEGASTIARILVVGQFVNAITGPAGYLLLLTGSQGTVARVYGFSAVAQIALLLAFVPGFGTDGAAVVTAATITVSNCLLYVFARRQSRQGTGGEGTGVNGATTRIEEPTAEIPWTLRKRPETARASRRWSDWWPAGLLLAACIFAVTYLKAWSSNTSGVHLLFWLAAAVMVVTVVALVVAGPTRISGFAASLSLGLLLFIPKLLHSPDFFNYFDELAHWRALDHLNNGSGLFFENPINKAVEFYPGLESAAGVLVSATGMSEFVAGNILIGALHALLAGALFLFYERVTDSPRIALLSVLVYAANPAFVFFDSYFAYESFALPLAASALAAAVLSERMSRRTAYGLLGVAFALCLVVVVCPPRHRLGPRRRPAAAGAGSAVGAGLGLALLQEHGLAGCGHGRGRRGLATAGGAIHLQLRRAHLQRDRRRGRPLRRRQHPAPAALLPLDRALLREVRQLPGGVRARRRLRLRGPAPDPSQGDPSRAPDHADDDHRRPLLPLAADRLPRLRQRRHAGLGVRLPRRRPDGGGGARGTADGEAGAGQGAGGPWRCS